VHPENSDWTCYEQNASLEILSFFGFESTIEKMAMKQYSQSVAKGKEVIDYFIKELKNEGVTYVAPWQPPQNDDKETDEKYGRGYTRPKAYCRGNDEKEIREFERMAEEKKGAGKKKQ
jgi:hypothetical protein